MSIAGGVTPPDTARIDILLVRHAHAGNPANWTGPDELRPLSAKGLRQATRIGGFLVAANIGPGVIVTSPKVRALQTAEVLGAALGWDVRLDQRLAQGPSMDDLRAIVGEAGDVPSLLLVGHDPDFSEIAGSLVGVSIAMRKGALARIEVPRDVSTGSGSLRWLVPPDALGR